MAIKYLGKNLLDFCSKNVLKYAQPSDDKGDIKLASLDISQVESSNESNV